MAGIQKIDYFIDEKTEMYCLVSDYAGDNMLGFAPLSSRSDLSQDEKIDLAHDLFEQLVSILAVLHKITFNINGNTVQFLHRDIKPENLTIKKDSTGKWILTIVDFGLSVGVGAGSPITSCWYESPDLDVNEINRYLAGRSHKCKPTDKSEMWAVGMMIAEILGGVNHPPLIKSAAGKIANQHSMLGDVYGIPPKPEHDDRTEEELAFRAEQAVKFQENLDRFFKNAAWKPADNASKKAKQQFAMLEKLCNGLLKFEQVDRLNAEQAVEMFAEPLEREEDDIFDSNITFPLMRSNSLKALNNMKQKLTNLAKENLAPKDSKPLLLQRHKSLPTHIRDVVLTAH
jgi:serine/threonine protein kinase